MRLFSSFMKFSTLIIVQIIADINYIYIQNFFIKLSVNSSEKIYLQCNSVALNIFHEKVT